MHRRRRLYAALVAITLWASPVLGDSSHAEPVDDEPFRIREWSLRVAGGVNPSSLIQYYALHGDVGLRLWSSADRWLRERDVIGRWIIEPWVAFVDDEHGKHKTSSFEIGVSPLFAKLTFGDGVVRPFIEGGEGIVYTDLRKQDYGTRIQFTSQIGAGLEYQLRDDVALTFAARFRHMSNAGLGASNPGINTLFGLVGVTFR
jgi:opacity protein-like surface antigen